MSHEPDSPPPLAAWSQRVSPDEVECLSNAGGFSGARLWRARSARGAFCLRRWPAEHPSPARLAWIHAVIEHAARQDLVPLATPVATNRGDTFVREGGHLWELTRWLPGEPWEFWPPSDKETLATVLLLREDRSTINPARQATTNACRQASMIAAAAAALARFHIATASFNSQLSNNQLSGIQQDAAGARGSSPTLRERWQRLQALTPARLERLRSAVLKANLWPRLAPLALETLELVPRAAPRVVALVEPCLTLEVDWQPCLRDIWSDHVLFTGGEVTGLIDYGAMRVESPAADFARLLGSIAGDDETRWSIGQQAYEAARERTFTAEEWRLAQAFDATQTLFSGWNWIEWIFLQRREFPDLGRVERRLQAIVERLRQAR